MVSVVSVCVSDVSMCQWCQYVSMMSVDGMVWYGFIEATYTTGEKMSVMSVVVSGFSMCQWCQYMLVMSVGVSGVSRCQWRQ